MPSHPLLRGLLPASCLALALLVQGCGNSDVVGTGVSTPANPAPVTPPPAVAADPGKALSSYLRNLSPKLEGVTAEAAVWEHYNIPVSDGTVLDGWIKRPPGEAGQPLVVVFTPYYGGGDPNLSALGTPADAFIAKLLPYGYAVGFISVGGTGNSGGCFRDGGPIERKQLGDAADYMASQTWSNGKVAAIGVSYDGTTANELFVDPPASIKTVVPMEAISDYYRYTFNIGGIIRESTTFFTTYYYPIVGLSPAGLNGGVGPTEPESYVTELMGEPCAEQLAIQQESVTTEVTANKTPFWQERDAVQLVLDSLDKPRPPMFFIQGYQDANVDPQMADGFLEAVAKTGVPLHIWMGQWVHAFPQSTGTAACAEKAPCRGDFFESFLLAWFDQFLKGRDTGVLDAPMVQTQADDGVWRHENSWPSNTLAPVALYPQADGTLGLASGSATASYTDLGANQAEETNTGMQIVLPVGAPGAFIEFVSAPLDKPMRLTGLPRFESLMNADAPRANVVATLMERFPDGTQRYLNFAALSLNHAESLASYDMDITGKALPVGINFYPQDNVVAAGSQLVLHLGGDVATEHVLSDGNSSNFLNLGPSLLPTGMGAAVSLDLTKTRLTLPANAGDRVERLSWLEAAP
ncbi:MAG: CocE/NonD family hydrolase [Pseudomonadota bacterium]